MSIRRSRPRPGAISWSAIATPTRSVARRIFRRPRQEKSAAGATDFPARRQAKTGPVRRIVTGHNAAGKAVIKTDEQIAAVLRIGAGISGAEIWSTDQMPIDNSAADAAQRAGFVKHTNYV